MFVATWSWVVPLLGALLAFVGVLITTPPGFKALSDVLLGSPRGPNADAAAYALGAAGAMALLALLLLAALCAVVELALRFGRPRR